MRTADLPRVVCRTASGSIYTVRPDGFVEGPRTGTLIARPGSAPPAVGGRLIINTNHGLVVTSELVEVDRA
jgi:hypothetical protein